MRWLLNKYSYVLNNPLALIDPDGLEEFRVFVHFNSGDPAPKNSPNWSAIQANAQQHGNTVTVFQGDAANSQNYQSSLSSPGTTIFIGHTQLVDNGGGPKVAAVSLSDKEVGQLIDHVPIFSTEPLTTASSYPQLGIARCEALTQWQDDRGRELVRITTARPDDIESTEGVSEFVVLSAQLSADSPAMQAPR